jgi:hypothetical protein
LYDSIFGDEKDITYEKFKEKYLKSIEIGNRSVKEAYAVGQLERVIHDKNYEEIDTMF